MNNNLLGMLSLLALTLGMVSCSNEDLDSTENVLTENVQKYGTHSSEVSLFFGSNKIASTVTTRSCDVNGNMWGDAMPEYPTQDEINGALAYIENNPGAEVDWPGYTCYFVQHLTGAHHMYSYTDRNNFTHSDIDGTSRMDLLEIEENRELKTWEIDPNTGKPYS